MAISEAFQDSATIGTTEYFLAADSTTQGSGQSTDGVYQLFLEVNNLAAGDTYRIRVWDAVASAGTVGIVEEWTISGVQTHRLWVTPSLILLHKWDFSVTKLAGTDRSIGWSIRKVA